MSNETDILDRLSKLQDGLDTFAANASRQPRHEWCPFSREEWDARIDRIEQTVTVNQSRILDEIGELGKRATATEIAIAGLSTQVSERTNAAKAVSAFIAFLISTITAAVITFMSR